MNNTRAWTIAAVATLLGACASTPSQPPPPASTDADLRGSWVLTTTSQMGAQDAQMVVRQQGSALTGTITGQNGSVDYTGKVAGTSVAFDFTINIQGTDLKLDYTGELVEMNTIQGKAVFGQFGEGTFTAKRQ